MTSEIAELNRLLKTHKGAIRYLRTLTKDELIVAVRQAVEPDKWHETAELVQRASVLLERFSRDLENALKNQN